MEKNFYDFILLIPCYNNEQGLIESIKSVFYPSQNFKIVIVDDGSSTPISNEKLIFFFPDIEIEVIRLSLNKGIVHALNFGLSCIQQHNNFKYLARLDVGDICDKERFTKQVNFLDNNPDVFLLGSWCIFYDTITKKKQNYITKIEHKDIAIEMHYKCSFIHPCTIFRREVLATIGFYPENFLHAEDYAFFWKILKKHKTAIIPKYLVTIATNNNTVSSKNYKTQLKSRALVIKHFGTHSFHIAMGVLLLFCKNLFPKKIIDKIKFRKK